MIKGVTVWSQKYAVCIWGSILTDHSSASSKCSLGALEEIINRLHVQVRLHQAGVDIYTPWYHHAAISLNHLDTPRNHQILPHLPAKDQDEKGGKGGE